MKNTRKALTIGFVAFFAFSNTGLAQCGTFSDASNSDQAENQYVIYRGDVKNKKFDEAYKTWQMAYKNAPAADGKRFDVWYDGVEIYKHKLQTATGADAEMYKKEIVRLYNEAIECVANKGVILKNCLDQKCIDEKVGFLAGRLAFDMFYTTQSPYTEQFKALSMSIDKAGNKAEYIVLEPMAYVAVNQFAEGNLDKAQTRDIYNRLNAIADHNIANNAQFKAYFESAKARMNAKFDEIAMNIFDCDYWKVKVKPEYDANPNDPETLKRLIATLKRQACQKGDPLLDEMESKYARYAQAENARRQAEFEANNPGILAKKAYDSGDFDGAAAKYLDAIEKEEDPEKQAGYYFSLSSIQFRRLNAYSDARRSALKAAELRPGWGRPYMLIGDMYASSSRSCGKDAYTRGLAVLAAIDMYSKAKSIDPEVASDATSRIGKYSASIPPKEDVFMRGKAEGDRVAVPCWIGGSVSLRYN